MAADISSTLRALAWQCNQAADSNDPKVIADTAFLVCKTTLEMLWALYELEGRLP